MGRYTYEERELIRLWFKDRLVSTDRGIVFRRGYYVEANFRERYIVLPPDTQVNRQKSLLIVRFSDGSESVLFNYAVKKIDTVKKVVEIKPLRRKDLILLNIRTPKERSDKLRHFLYESAKVLAFREELIEQQSGTDGEDDYEAIVIKIFDALIKTEDKDSVPSEIRKMELVPYGIKWKILCPHPTHAEVEDFGIFDPV